MQAGRSQDGTSLEGFEIGEGEAKATLSVEFSHALQSYLEQTALDDLLPTLSVLYLGVVFAQRTANAGSAL